MGLAKSRFLQNVDFNIKLVEISIKYLSSYVALIAIYVRLVSMAFCTAAIILETLNGQNDLCKLSFKIQNIVKMVILNASNRTPIKMI